MREARLPTAIHDPLERPLTPRERQVLMLAAEGLSNKQIGRQLGISEVTVKNHMCALMYKLKAGSRTAAAMGLFYCEMIGCPGRSWPDHGSDARIQK